MVQVHNGPCAVTAKHVHILKADLVMGVLQSSVLFK